jgi:hypothetical protein
MFCDCHQHDQQIIFIAETRTRELQCIYSRSTHHFIKKWHFHEKQKQREKNDIAHRAPAGEIRIPVSRSNGSHARLKTKLNY